MTFLHTDPRDPTAPMWLFHLATLTLAQLHLNGGPDGNHLLAIDSSGHVPDETIASFAATLETMAPGASSKLLSVSRISSGLQIPGHLILVPMDPAVGGAIIHCPRLGLTAGVRGDGSKIPPSWKNPDRYSPDERTSILQLACDTLIQAIVANPVAGQAA